MAFVNLSASRNLSSSPPLFQFSKKTNLLKLIAFKDPLHSSAKKPHKSHQCVFDFQENDETQGKKGPWIQFQAQIAGCVLPMFLFLSCWPFWIHDHIPGTNNDESCVFLVL